MGGGGCTADNLAAVFKILICSFIQLERIVLEHIKHFGSSIINFALIDIEPDLSVGLRSMPQKLYLYIYSSPIHRQYLSVGY